MIIKDVEKDFINLLKKTSNESCWLYLSGKDKDGYGRLTLDGKRIRAHRFAYELFNNTKIPEGMIICHKCDNPPCCNPTHLFLGTHQDNIKDKVNKGRGWNPILYGEKNGNSKLTDIEREEIRKLRKQYPDITAGRISEIYNISRGALVTIIGYKFKQTTEKERDEIYELYRTNKYTQKDIAKIYDITQPCVCRIVNNKRIMEKKI